MFCVDHVECVVGFHKVCRMIVPSVLEVMMGLQLFAILSGFVQKYTHSKSQTVHSCIHFGASL